MTPQSGDETVLRIVLVGPDGQPVNLGAPASGGAGGVTGFATGPVRPPEEGQAAPHQFRQAGSRRPVQPAATVGDYYSEEQTAYRANALQLAGTYRAGTVPPHPPGPLVPAGDGAGAMVKYTGGDRYNVRFDKKGEPPRAKPVFNVKFDDPKYNKKSWWRWSRFRKKYGDAFRKVGRAAGRFAGYRAARAAGMGFAGHQVMGAAGESIGGAIGEAGASSAAGMAMAGLAAGAAIATAGVALLTKAVIKFGEEMVERGKQLAAYSPQLAAAGARAGIREMQGDMLEARTLGTGMASVTDSMSQMRKDFREIMLPIKLALQAGEAYLMSTAGGVVTDAKGFLSGLTATVANQIWSALKLLGMDVKKIADNTDPNSASANPMLDQFMNKLGDNLPNIARPPDVIERARGDNLGKPDFSGF